MKYAWTVFLGCKTEITKDLRWLWCRLAACVALEEQRLIRRRLARPPTEGEGYNGQNGDGDEAMSETEERGGSASIQAFSINAPAMQISWQWIADDSVRDATSEGAATCTSPWGRGRMRAQC